jgi:chloride channel 7
MGENVCFLRPVEKVGVIIDILQSSQHGSFPVIDTDDNDVLYGTIGRNALCALLKHRAFGQPKQKNDGSNPTVRVYHNYFEHNGEKYMPLVDWDALEGSYPRYPTVDDVRISLADRECLMDLRPYCNTAPITVQEQASVEVSSERKHVITLCLPLSLTCCIFFYSAHMRSFGPWA